MPRLHQHREEVLAGETPDAAAAVEFRPTLTFFLRARRAYAGSTAATTPGDVLQKTEAKQ
jgi:hypothetical protein